MRAWPRLAVVVLLLFVLPLACGPRPNAERPALRPPLSPALPALAERNLWLMVEAVTMMAAPGGGARVAALCQRASEAGYNGLVLWDSNLWDRQLPAPYLKNAAVLKSALTRLGFTLVVEICPQNSSLFRWSGDPTILEPRPPDPRPDERDYRYLCLSHPGVLPIWEEQLRRARQIYHPNGWLFQYDELRVAASDARCRATGKSPGQLLAEHTRAAVGMCRRVDPGSVVAVWGDMFDPYHNAGKVPYYHVARGFAGSWEGIDRGVLVFNFNDDARSFRFWADRGNQQIVAGYFDGELGLAKEKDLMAEARRVPGVVGWMYTTWKGRYEDLGTYAAALGFGPTRAEAAR